MTEGTLPMRLKVNLLPDALTVKEKLLVPIVFLQIWYKMERVLASHVKSRQNIGFFTSFSRTQP